MAVGVFKITIQREAKGRYPIVAEALGEGDLPTRATGLWEYDRVEMLRALPAGSYGTLLGRVVFHDKILHAFARARGHYERLHVLLAVEPEELRGLRWERLCGPVDGDRWEPLARSPQTPLSIHLDSTSDQLYRPFSRRELRALVLVASPPDLDAHGFERFDAAGALRSVREGLGETPHDCLWEGPGAIGRPTLAALVEHLTRTRYTLLHLVCHGVFGRDEDATEGVVPETAILIEGADGRVDRVTTTRLIEALGKVGERPHFAFLATCESADPRAEGALGGLAHRLVRELGMPAVVAMTEKISQRTALALGSKFYPQLREHGCVDRALVEALAAAALERHDVAVPALFSRLGGRPLWRDDADRPPTTNELALALRELVGLIHVRAPCLDGEREKLAAELAEMLDPVGLSRERMAAREELLRRLDALCLDALDISFLALARGTQPPKFEPHCPFPGLQAFTIKERGLYFGRDELLSRLESGLQRARLVAVHGPSGCGKSSLIAAGLALCRERSRPDLTKQIVMVPSSRPMIRLERALAGEDLGDAFTRAEAAAQRPGAATGLLRAPVAVLVVDQFEELLTHCSEPTERAEFARCLLALTQELLVVVAVRDDFLDDLRDGLPELFRAIEAGALPIRPMTPPEIRTAIERQAAAVGLVFDRDLVPTLLESIGGEAGAMPLVQHVLRELFLRRHGRHLRLDEYRALGGIAAALTRTADAIHDDLKDQGERDRLRRIFLRLVRLEVDTPADATAAGTTGRSDRSGRRRRVAIDDLYPATETREATQALLDVLVARRLLVTGTSPQTGREIAEISHEELLRRWSRLHQWLREEDPAVLQRVYRFQDAVRAWRLVAAAERGPLLIHQDASLDEFSALSASGRFPFNRDEADYYQACAAAREAARAHELAAAKEALTLEKDRLKVERTVARQLRQRVWAIAVVGLIAVAAAVASGALYVRSEQALRLASEKQQEADAAEEKAVAGETRAQDASLLAELEGLGPDSTRKALLLREVASPAADPRFHEHLIFLANEPRATSGFDRASPFTRQAPPRGESGLILDHSGERIVALEAGGALAVRAVRGPDRLWTAEAPPGPVRSGTLVASPLGDGAFRLGAAPGFQAALAVKSRPIPIPLVAIHDVDASRGRPRALARLERCDLALVDVDVSSGTAAERCLLPAAPDLRAALLLPVADAVLVASTHGEATLLRLADGSVAGKLELPRGSERSRPGRRPAILGAARDARGSTFALVTPERVDAWSVEPSGRLSLALGSGERFGEHEHLWGVFVDDDVPHVVDAEGALWALEGGAWRRILRIPPLPTRKDGQVIVHSPSARVLAIGAGPKLWLVDLRARRLRAMHGHTSTITEIAISGDGRRLASADLEAVRVWDLDEPLGLMRWVAREDPRPAEAPGKSPAAPAPASALRILDAADDGRLLLGLGDAAHVLYLDRRDARDQPLVASGVQDARFLPGEVIAMRTDAGAGVWLSAGGLHLGETDQGWDPARVFGDPARVFVDRGVLWGVDADGRGFVFETPGGAATGGDFDPGRRHLLLWRGGSGEAIERATLVAASGERSELMGPGGPLAGKRVGHLAWAPNGARLLASYAEEARVCVLIWPPDDPAAARSRCVERTAAADGEPDLLRRHALRAAVWSADSARIALVVGDGTVLLDAVGDAAPVALETWSERWERTELRFAPGGDLLIETTASGVYMWPLERPTAIPITLVDFEASDPPDLLATLPLGSGRVLMTVSARRAGSERSLATRRWHVDAADAASALASGSLFCLEPAWRRTHLHERDARAWSRYCGCRSALRIPDPTCEDPSAMR